MKRVPALGKSIGFALACLVIGVATNLAAQVVMNGKPVRAYEGRVSMLNEQEGRIVIDVSDGSRGNWRVGGYTVVLQGVERVPLRAALSSPRVTVWVSPDGTVQRITLGAMQRAPVAVRPMNGAAARSYVGRVEMMNLRDGKIVIDVSDGSRGNWRVGGYTEVLRGGARAPLQAALESRRVQVWVTREGLVERINILQGR